jgi:sodium-coupled neutral amino acid transporter 11
MDRFARVTHLSTGVSMFACLFMALSGFLTFGDKTEGNVLNNFPTDNIMVNVARLCAPPSPTSPASSPLTRAHSCFGLNMLTTLPLEAFVCREVMMTYFHPQSGHSTPRHVLYTTGLVVAAVLLSLVTCDLGAVFELIGATSACSMAYIMPPLCYIKLSRRSWRTWVAWAVVTFGSCVLVISTILAVKNLASGGEGKKCV